MCIGMREPMLEGSCYARQFLQVAEDTCVLRQMVYVIVRRQRIAASAQPEHSPRTTRALPCTADAVSFKLLAFRRRLVS